MKLRPGHLFRLAWADLRDEWPIAVAVTLAIAAVLAPLLVLSGLQNGVVGEVFERLRADPALRRITLDATGSRRFDDTWFRTMRARQDVGFVLPSTRFAAAQVEITPVQDTSAGPMRVSLIPTDTGDPVFADDVPVLLAPNMVFLTWAVADRLGLKRGDRVFLDVERRRRDGRVEAAGIEAEIAGIAELQRHRGTAAFVQPSLLFAVERFRDGFAAPLLGIEQGENAGPREVFPNFRLYAHSIEDVTALANHLRSDQGLSVTAREAEISSAIELNRNITAVLRAIIVLGVIGLAGVLAAVQWAAAARKRRTIAMLALIGYGRSWLVGFPVTQALILGLTGIGAGIFLSGGAALWINAFFADSFGASGAACRLSLVDMAGAGAVVLLFSLLPAILIGLHYNRLEPSDEIREM